MDEDIEKLTIEEPVEEQDNTFFEDLDEKQKEVFLLLEEYSVRKEVLKKCKASTMNDIIKLLNIEKTAMEETETEVETAETKTNTADQDWKRYGEIAETLDETVDNMTCINVKTAKIKDLTVQLTDLKQATELFSRSVKTSVVKHREARVCFLLSGKIATYIEEQQKNATSKWGGTNKDDFLRSKCGVSDKTFKRMKEAWRLYQDMPELFCNSSKSVEYLIKSHLVFTNFFIAVDNVKDGKYAGKTVKDHWKKKHWNKTWSELQDEFK